MSMYDGAISFCRYSGGSKGRRYGMDGMAAMARVLGAQRRMHARKSTQEVVKRLSGQDSRAPRILSGRLISLRMSHFKSCERRRAAFLQHAAFNWREWRSPSMAQGANRRALHPPNAQATGTCPRQVYEDDTRTEETKVFFPLLS